MPSTASSLRTLALAASLVSRAARTGRPRPASTAERLASIPTDGLPLRAGVEIRWDAHQVPSIEASSEWDLAVALGAVHAHLRLAQMEAMRRLAAGRVAEAVGPVGIELDRALRLMLPGLPLVALGRNEWLAWGGTSLHAASSDLVDVSAEPMTERLESVPVRGRPPVTLRLRDTRFGPVVSDGILLRSARPLALRWVGHRPSDEMTAMLGVMRARTLDEFRAALGRFAVPGQTMVAVEAGPAGRASRVVAAHLPRRANAPMPRLVCAPDEVWSLDDLLPGTAFPAVEEDVVASANDRPGATPVPVGFFFSPPDRVRRLRALLERASPAGLEAMRAVQLDVVQPGALALRDRLLSRLPPLPRHAAARAALAGWDGSYDVGSQGALAFEAIVGALARRVVPARTLVLLSAIWSGRALIAQHIAEAPPPALAAALREADRVLRRCRTWGGAHRLALRHPFAALPLVGRWYGVRGRPAAGGNDTLNKTGHPLVRGRHRVTYGACARHVSDLADPDANWFVLLGGQDGWLGSANAADQLPLWEAGQAIQVPLRPASAHTWPYRTRLHPA